MKKYRFFVLIVCFLIMGCQTEKGQTIKKLVPEKFSCLTAPNGAYQAGTIIRTVAGTDAKNNISPDQMTVAYLPISPPSLTENYIDIEQTLSTGASAALTAKKLEKYGVLINLSGQGSYALSLTAKKNKIMIGDDDLRMATAKKLNERESLIKNARYFFVKEALGSQEILYQAKSSAGAEANAKLESDSSGLAVKINLFDKDKKLSSANFLIACVLLEEIAISRGAGGDGTTFLTISEKSKISKSEIPSAFDDLQIVR